MIEITHKDIVKYLLGILILLAFLAILGIYLFFLGRIPFGSSNYGAGVILAGQGNNDDELNQRILAVQREIDETLARVKELENANKPAVTPARPANTNTQTPVTNPFLKISRFSANQILVSSGSQVNFSYAAENTSRGASFRLLLQCPSGVSAIYSNGSNVCRRTIGEALPIDNSGNYSVTLTNNTSEPAVLIAVLLASDITDGVINFRDSKVITVTVMPTNYSPVSNSDYSLSLSMTPTDTVSAPATISFTATLNDLNTCVQSHWEFGDGMITENFVVCPNSVSSIKSRTLFENHQYNQSGTYTATFFAGNKRMSKVVYVSPHTYYSTPTYYPTYNYTQPNYSYYNPPVYNYTPPPVYNYVYQQPPVYNYTYPAQPEAPSTPTNFRAVLSNNSAVVLSWSAPSSGNTSTYTIYRRGGSSLPAPISGSSSSCVNGTSNTCHYIVSGSLTSFTDNNVNPGSIYTYRVVASNAYGVSNPSDGLTLTIPESNTPAVPSTFTARVDAGRIILNWSGPSAGTPGNISSYTIYRRGAGSLPIPVSVSVLPCTSGDLSVCYFSVSGQTLSLVDSNILPGTTYTYRIVATNPFGTSEYSDSITITSPQTTVTPPVVFPTISFSSNPVVPMVESNGMTVVMCQSSNSISTSRLRAYTTDTFGRDKRFCSFSSMDTQGGVFRYKFGCYGPNDRSTVDGSLIMGTPRNFVCEEVDASGIPLVPSNSRSIVRNCNTGDAGTGATCNGTTATPPVTPDPVITSYTINGQTSPTVSSGSTLNLSYSGNNVSSYRLFVQCPANVAVTDQSNSSNLCRTNSNDAVTITSAGSYQIAIFNSNNSNQTVGVTLLAYRANGTLSHSINRPVLVTAQVVTPTPTPVPPPTPPTSSPDALITSFTVDGQTSPTVSSGSLLNISYTGTNVSSYRLLIQCPANVAVTDQSNSSNLCRTNQNDAFTVSPSGSYQLAIYNMNAGNQNVTASILAFRANGTLSHSITRTIIVRPQPGF